MNIIKRLFQNILFVFIAVLLLNFFLPLNVKANTYTKHSYSYGRAENYDRVGHTTLGYMSNNTSTYWSGSYYFSSSKPRKPSDYYGTEVDDGSWILQSDYAWDESSVQHSKDPKWAYKTKYDDYYWISSTTSTKNRYRKGVYLK